jgi:hypothetical protein
LLTTTPLIECGKQLAILVSRLAYICEQGLTAIATKATIGMGAYLRNGHPIMGFSGGEEKVEMQGKW